MISKTVILLAPFEDCSNHRLSKHIEDYLAFPAPFDRYFREPLQKIFSKVIVYDYIKRMTDIGVRAVNEEIIDLVRKQHPQYVLWLPMRYEIRESTFESIRKEGTIVIGWFPDDDTCFDKHSKWWIPYLDYCVTNDIEAVPKYRALNAWVTQALGGTGIAIDRDWSNTEEKYYVSFVGYRDVDREQRINELKKRNIPIHLSGRGWGVYVSFEEMIDIFKTSKINLNFSQKHNSSKLQMKGRIFEVCLAGGFLLTQYVSGIENYFETDKEIVCFHNTEEMIGKIIYYLNHETERRAIARAGWERATAEYTSFHIVSRVFGEIEEDVAAKGKKNTSHPQGLRMPRQVRKRFSDYYFNWGNAFSQENYEGLWKDALALSVSYNPLNIRAWLYYIIGFFPSFIRAALIKLYTARKSLLHGYIPDSSTRCT